MPLSDDEKAWAEKKIAAGTPKEQVFDFLALRRGQGTNAPLGEYGPGGKLYPAGTGNIPGGYEQAGLLQEFAESPGKAVARRALPMAGAILGGMGGRALGGALGPVGRAVTQAGGEALGMFGGVLGAQGATGAELDPKQAALAAGMVGAASLGTSSLAYGGGRAGGVSSKAASAAVGRPGFAAKVPAEAEHALSVKMAETAKAMPKTQGRIDIEKMIDAHDAAGKRIDALQAWSQALSQAGTKTGVHPANKAADTAMKDVADRLFERLLQEDAGGQLTAKQFDKVIREEFTTHLRKELLPGGPHGGSVTAGRLASLRGDLQEMLYNSLGSGAKEAGQQAAGALRSREALLKYFGGDEFGAPRLSTPGRVAAAAAPANRSGPTLLKKIQAFDEVNGSDLTGEVIRLAQKREWGPAEERTANYISSVLQMSKGGVGTVGALRNLTRAMGRTMVRLQGKTGAGARALTFNPDMQDRQRQAFEEQMRLTP